MRYLFLLSLATVVFASAGCSQHTPAVNVSVIPVPVNSFCPIMGGKVVPDGGSAIWNGTTVAFCCESCAPKWDKLSQEEKAAKLATANNSAHDNSAHDHSAHDHSAHDHSAHDHES
jgi:hypothetical protein